MDMGMDTGMGMSNRLTARKPYQGWAPNTTVTMRSGCSTR
jgi:hypothetical protein